jgi:hypothetical protein
MAQHPFVDHGGGVPPSDTEKARVMNRWGEWMGGMGAALLGGAHPASGYSLIEAASLTEALAHAKACPILSDGGSVEGAQAMDM